MYTLAQKYLMSVNCKWTQNLYKFAFPAGIKFVTCNFIETYLNPLIDLG